MSVEGKQTQGAHASNLRDHDPHVPSAAPFPVPAWVAIVNVNSAHGGSTKLFETVVQCAEVRVGGELQFGPGRFQCYRWCRSVGPKELTPLGAFEAVAIVSPDGQR